MAIRVSIPSSLRENSHVYASALLLKALKRKVGRKVKKEKKKKEDNEKETNRDSEQSPVEDDESAVTPEKRIDNDLMELDDSDSLQSEDIPKTIVYIRTKTSDFDATRNTTESFAITFHDEDTIDVSPESNTDDVENSTNKDIEDLQSPKSILRPMSHGSGIILVQSFSDEISSTGPSLFDQLNACSIDVIENSEKHGCASNISTVGDSSEIITCMNETPCFPDMNVLRQALGKDVEPNEVFSCKNTSTSTEPGYQVTKGTINFGKQECLSFEYTSDTSVLETDKTAKKKEAKEKVRKNTLIAWKEDVEIVQFDDTLSSSSSSTNDVIDEEGNDQESTVHCLGKDTDLIISVSLVPLLFCVLM